MTLLFFRRTVGLCPLASYGNGCHSSSEYLTETYLYDHSFFLHPKTNDATALRYVDVGIFVNTVQATSDTDPCHSLPGPCDRTLNAEAMDAWKEERKYTHALTVLKAALGLQKSNRISRCFNHHFLLLSPQILTNPAISILNTRLPLGATRGWQDESVIHGPAILLQKLVARLS